MHKSACDYPYVSDIMSPQIVPLKTESKQEENMNANVAIQVLPHVDTDEEVVRIVDEVIAYIKSTGLHYYVGPCETAIEGEYEELMEIIKNCQYIAIKAGCPKVASYVKISFAPEGGVLTIDQKVTKHHK